MIKVVSAIALAAATIAPAQAATTITTNFAAGSSVIPSFTTATVFQNFNQAAGAFVATPNQVVGGTTAVVTTGNGQQVTPAVTPTTVGAAPLGGFLAIGKTSGSGDTTGSFTVSGLSAQVFSFVFGSLEAGNRVTLNFATGPATVMNGLQICGGAATVGCALTSSGRVTYDFGGTAVLNSVEFFTSGGPTAVFEIDALASAAPEPAAWALMILGFGLVGSQLRRRKGKLALSAA